MKMMMNMMMNIMMNMMMKFCDRKSGYYVLTHVLMVDSVWVKQVCFKHSVFVRACMRANTCVCVKHCKNVHIYYTLYINQTMLMSGESRCVK